MKLYNCDICGKVITLKDRCGLMIGQARRFDRKPPIEFDLCADCAKKVKDEMFKHSKKTVASYAENEEE